MLWSIPTGCQTSWMSLPGLWIGLSWNHGDQAINAATLTFGWAILRIIRSFCVNVIVNLTMTETRHVSSIPINNTCGHEDTNPHVTARCIYRQQVFEYNSLWMRPPKVGKLKFFVYPLFIYQISIYTCKIMLCMYAGTVTCMHV